MKYNQLTDSQFKYKLIIRNEKLQLIEAIVDFLESRLLERVEQLHPKPLGLATGRTMVPIYRLLIRRINNWPSHQRNKLLDNWLSFNLDEYIGLERSDKRNFFNFMQRNLAGQLNLSSKQIRVPNGASLDPQKEAENYLIELNDSKGLGVQLLGLGVNGHIGFNEPNSAFNSSCRVVYLSNETKKQNSFDFNNDLNKVPNCAITLGIADILAAEEIHLIVTGSSKAKIVRDFFTSPVSKDLPVSCLRGHKNLYIWLDIDAYKMMQ